MSGFPNRPGRGNFGPTMRNARPVVDPSRELGANAINLAWWQLAGAGRVLPMALLILNTDGTLLHQALAFDPRAKLDPIPTARSSAGVYTVTFASSYADEGGIQRSFIPRAAMAAPQGAAAGLFVRTSVVGQVVQLSSLNGATPTDARILLQVW